MSEQRFPWPRPRSISQLSITIALVLSFSLISCKHENTPTGPIVIEDSWPTLFDMDSGIQIAADPSYYSTTDTIILAVKVHPLYAGVGHWSLYGSLQDDINAPVGTAYSPVSGEFGFLSTHVSFEEGKEVTITWRITLKPTQLLHVATLQASAGFDSVVVDGTMCAIGSPELIPYFGFDYFYFVTGLLRLYEP